MNDYSGAAPDAAATIATAYVAEPVKPGIVHLEAWYLKRHYWHSFYTGQNTD